MSLLLAHHALSGPPPLFCATQHASISRSHIICWGFFLSLSLYCMTLLYKVSSCAGNAGPPPAGTVYKPLLYTNILRKWHAKRKEKHFPSACRLSHSVDSFSFRSSNASSQSLWKINILSEQLRGRQASSCSHLVVVFHTVAWILSLVVEITAEDWMHKKRRTQEQLQSVSKKIILNHSFKVGKFNVDAILQEMLRMGAKPKQHFEMTFSSHLSLILSHNFRCIWVVPACGGVSPHYRQRFSAGSHRLLLIWAWFHSHWDVFLSSKECGLLSIIFEKTK